MFSVRIHVVSERERERERKRGRERAMKQTDNRRMNMRFFRSFLFCFESFHSSSDEETHNVRERENKTLEQ